MHLLSCEFAHSLIDRHGNWLWTWVTCVNSSKHSHTQKLNLSKYITHTDKLLIACCVRCVLCPMQIHSAEAAAQPWGANPRQEVSLSDSSFSPLPPLRFFDQCVASSAFSRYCQHVYASVYTHFLCICLHLSEYITPLLLLSQYSSLFIPRLLCSAVKFAPLFLQMSFPLSVNPPPLLVFACVCVLYA